MDTFLLGHKIKLDPTKEQALFFAKGAGTARYTWNWALEQRIAHYKNTKKSKNLNVLKKEWNHSKPDWVYETPKDANQQPFADLKTAFTKYFKSKEAIKIWAKSGKKGPKPREVGHPQFKKKYDFDSFYLSNSVAEFDETLTKLWVPLLGWVKMTEPLRFFGKIMGYRITRIADEWFVSINIEATKKIPKKGEIKELGKELKALKDKKRSVVKWEDGVEGADLGVTKAVTLSSGRWFDAPKPLKENLRALKRLQRKLKNKKIQSNRKTRLRVRIARLHARIARIRKDWIHKLTTRLCKEFSVIVLENLNINGMVKNHKSAKAILDIGWYEFKRQLKYKAELYGCTILQVGQFYPSSKLCSNCGEKNCELGREEKWSCSACKAEHDRDENAAKNLRNEGLKWCKGEASHAEWIAVQSTLGLKGNSSSWTSKLY